MRVVSVNFRIVLADMSRAVNEREGRVAFVVSAASAGGSQTATNKSEENADSSDLDSEKETNSSEDKTDSKDAEESKTRVVDPIRWFGILVPPALRSAQVSFVSGVEGPVSQLSSLAADLRRSEVDIGRLRKQIKKL